MNRHPLRPLYQVGAFARKEIADVVRQPQLLLVLVLGPFLVLVAFGLGYRDTPDPMRTVFVGPPDSPLLEQVERYADGLDDFVVFAGIEHEFAVAERRLLRDVIVGFPDDPAAAVLGGEPAMITITHTRLDPIERSAIVFASRLAVDNVNGEILSRIVAAGQDLGTTAVDRAGGAADLLSEQGDAGVISARQAEYATLLGRGAEQVDRFLELDPDLMVQPFAADVDLAVPAASRPTDWYVPAAVVLIVQQFGVAFGALSFVREQRLGIVEVFRAAPVGAVPGLVGKYVAYLALGGVVGAALTALVVAGLGVPVAGGLASVVVVVGLTLFASIGLGIVISLASRSDAQAVQYTMIVLLASLFFSGFFLSVDQMRDAARAVGFLLPVTYAMESLRDVMLRGTPLDPVLVAGLGAYGVALFALALLGARRRMAAVA